MDLVNLSAIDRFVRKHRDAAKWLANWIDVAQAAAWKNLQDVRKQFPSADGVQLKSRVIVTVFNVKGNEYRLLTIIDYPAQRVVICDVLTHEEYSRDRWK
jgi:mRNA interferase HigB